MCSWSNTQTLKVDKLDWELTSQEAETHYSTPTEDHTLGTERGKPERDKQGRSYFDCAYCGQKASYEYTCVSLHISKTFIEPGTRNQREQYFFNHKCVKQTMFPLLSARSLPVLSKQQPDGSRSKRSVAEPSPSPD